jgi:hypothetical protein
MVANSGPCTITITDLSVTQGWHDSNGYSGSGSWSLSLDETTVGPFDTVAIRTAAAAGTKLPAYCCNPGGGTDCSGNRDTMYDSYDLTTNLGVASIAAHSYALDPTSSCPLCPGPDNVGGYE